MTYRTFPFKHVCFEITLKKLHRNLALSKYIFTFLLHQLIWRVRAGKEMYYVCYTHRTLGVPCLLHGRENTFQKIIRTHLWNIATALLLQNFCAMRQSVWAADASTTLAHVSCYDANFALVLMFLDCPLLSCTWVTVSPRFNWWQDWQIWFLAPFRSRTDDWRKLANEHRNRGQTTKGRMRANYARTGRSARFGTTYRCSVVANQGLSLKNWLLGSLLVHQTKVFCSNIVTAWIRYRG